MGVSMSQFTEHYIHLHDEELIHIALTRELVPEAMEALRAELTKRGITDLGAHRTQLQREFITEETGRQANIAVVSLGVLISYIASAAICLYGLYLIVAPSPAGPVDDGVSTLKLGLGLFVITFVWSWAQHLWRKHVLYRRPPL